MSQNKREPKVVREVEKKFTNENKKEELKVKEWVKPIMHEADVFMYCMKED